VTRVDEPDGADAAGGWRFEAVPGRPLDGPLDGPVWDGAALLVCRPDANEIVRIDPTTGAIELFRQSSVGTRGLAFGPDGRLYGAQARARRVVWFDSSGRTFYLEAMLEGHRHNDPQDLAVDRAGRIWFTDDWTETSTGGPVGWPALDHRSVLRLTQESETDDGIGTWALERTTHDTTGPRGIAFDPEETTLYVSDRGDGAGAPATLRGYPLEGTGLGSVRVLHTFGSAGASGDPRAGDVALGDTPGGLCVAADGRIIVAVADSSGRRPSAAAVFEPDGRLAAVHAIPAGTATNVTLGGAERRTLYVTTSEGRLWRVDPTDPTDPTQAGAQ
jgi:sugar lactone lactonase YvrE